MKHINSPFGLITYNEESHVDPVDAKQRWALAILINDQCLINTTTRTVGANYQFNVVHQSLEKNADQWNFGFSRLSSECVQSISAYFEPSGEFLDETHKVNDLREAGLQRKPSVQINRGNGLVATVFEIASAGEPVSGRPIRRIVGPRPEEGSPVLVAVAQRTLPIICLGIRQSKINEIIRDVWQRQTSQLQDSQESKPCVA